MKRLGVVLCGLVLAAVPAAAQSGGVNGTVVDESGGILPGCSISIDGPGGSQTTFADGSGAFSFAGLAAGTYEVTIALSGFQDAEQEVQVGDSAADLGSITLALAGLGETIVVSASRIETTLIDSPVTMTVLTADQLQNAPSSNFGDILRNVPGLNVVQMGARDIQLASRKATGTLETSQLVLLDGRTIYLDFFGFVLWDLVPTNPGLIHQIEVVRGPASAVWGANALTGVVNIRTKSPRQSEGFSLGLRAGTADRSEGSRADDGNATHWGGDFHWAQAPSDSFSYRVSGGYLEADAYSRPTGTIPITTHPLDSSVILGGAPYPTDNQGLPGQNAFRNSDTQQPRFDLRVDHDFENGGNFSWGGGYAGTQGIIHTGIGPFDIQNGSYMGYGQLAYRKDRLRIGGFVNWLDVDAPNLLLPDPATFQPILLNFNTQTWDFDLGHSSIIADKHIISYGGNVRRNNFEITLTPDVENRTEAGAYVQGEFFLDKFRLTAGGRVDKFGNIEDPVFSPRVTLAFKPAQDHSIRVSYNRAFRSPSAVNNFLDQAIFAPGVIVDLTPICAAVPLPGCAQVTGPVPLIVNNVGNPLLRKEKLDAIELAYIGTFGGKTTVGAALYRNDTDHSINFVSLLPTASNPMGLPGFEVYTPLDPPPGMPGDVFGFCLAAGLCPPLPKTVSSYHNLSGLRQVGVELSLDHRFNSTVSAFVNYSWQDTPEQLEPDSDQIAYPTEEVGIAPSNRFNIGVNANASRWFGQVAVNYQGEGLWVDVLTSEFHGFTDAFTMLNASVGMHFGDGRFTAQLKAHNLTNETVQQHVFGDILKRSITAELRINLH